MATADLPGLHRLSLHALAGKSDVSAILSGVDPDDLWAGNWLLDAEAAVLDDEKQIDVALRAIASDLVQLMRPRNCARWNGDDPEETENLFGELSIHPLWFPGGVTFLLAGRWKDWSEGGLTPSFELRCQARKGTEWMSTPVFQEGVHVRTPLRRGAAGHPSWLDLCNDSRLTSEGLKEYMYAIYDAFKETGVATEIKRVLTEQRSFTADDRSAPSTPKRSTTPPQIAPFSAPGRGPKRSRRVEW